MPPVTVDPERVREFADAATLLRLARRAPRQRARGLDQHPQARLGPRRRSRPAEAIDVALCWGWIDAIRKGLDETSYLQRYVPRGRKSTLEPDQRRERRAG